MIAIKDREEARRALRIPWGYWKAVAEFDEMGIYFERPMFDNIDHEIYI